MKIGHSNNKSETFLPTQAKCELTGINFTDVAGQNDARGPLIDFIN